MATKVLHIDSSILGPNSVSRSLSAAVLARLKAANPQIEVTYRDLAATPIPHLTGSLFAARQAGPEPQDPALQADLALGSAVLDEFLAADIVVLGLGFYNFGVPSQVKAWVDRLAVAGKTFRYGANGPEGLVAGKRVILAISRGGFYGPGTPAQSLEHAETYLRGIFAFFGITQIEVVSAEGVAFGPEARQSAIAKAHAYIDALAA
jgi:FMN-dependent NADH-azoreductase